MQKSSFSFIVVEDDLHANESIVKRMNKFENWNCIGKETILDEAISKIEINQPDLLFLDWEVIGGNTFILLDKINKIDDYKPYIIYFTGYQNDNPQIPVDIVNKYKVNKYLVKPIFEDLTENLSTYIEEAEDLLKHHIKELWITTIEKQKLKIEANQIVCISQSRANPRNKIIHCSNHDLFEFKASWEICEMIALKHGINFLFANARDTMVNINYISKIHKPYIWLNQSIKVEVTKDRWKILELEILKSK